VIKLKPHCIRCGHFKVDDVSALEASSKPPVHIVEDNVTASLPYFAQNSRAMPSLGMRSRLENTKCCSFLILGLNNPAGQGINLVGHGLS
jgi:hypothetical protein